MTEEIAKLCKKYCGAVAVSWYRSQYTLDAIKMLLNANVRTNIHYVLGKNTIDEAMHRLKNNDFPVGINAVIFLLHKPVGFGTINNVLDVNDERVKLFFNEFNKEHNFKVGVDSCTVPAVLNYTDEIDIQSLDTCEGGRFSCYISADMKIMPCSFDQTERYSISLRDSSILEAWNSKNFEIFRSSLHSRCPSCEKRVNCMGGCPLMSQIVLCNKNEENF